MINRKGDTTAGRNTNLKNDKHKETVEHFKNNNNDNNKILRINTIIETY